MTISEESGERVTGNLLVSTLRLDWNISVPSTSSSSVMGMLTGINVVEEVKVRVSVVGS